MASGLNGMIRSTSAISLFVVFVLVPFVQMLMAREHGDIILGGLFPVHMKGAGSKKCGDINKDRGIQRIEAMLYALDKINNDTTLLNVNNNKVKLGAIILDTCSSNTYALNQSLEFIRAAINIMDASGFQCADKSTPYQRVNSKPIKGVVGGSYSEVSVQVANLLRLFRIPQVSPASTGTVLSDKSRYDFFARTVPPDNYQVEVLADIVQKFNWTYVSLISSEGQYGDSGSTAFQREARARNICIPIIEEVPHHADNAKFDEIFSNLHEKDNAKGVILFLREEDARGILAAAKRSNRTHNFVFLAPDAWGRQQKLVEGLEDVAEGAITVELTSQNIDEFNEYMMNLTPETNNRNPWFKEYWEKLFQCKVDDESHRGYNNGYVYNATEVPCSQHLRLDSSVGYTQEPKVQFVVDAVYAFAYALDNLMNDICFGIDFANCTAMQIFDGGDFYQKYLLNTSFTDLAGFEVKFDSKGDGLARYTILNYRRTNNGSSDYEYAVVGNWSNGLQINMDDIVWHNGQKEVPKSVCSQPCEPGKIKILQQQGESCCWLCNECKPWEYVHDDFTCADCGDGRWPYQDKKGCYDLDRLYMRWLSIFAIVAIVIACFGIMLTTWAILVFIRNNDTPIVRASGRELSYMLLAGMLISYLMTFVLLAKPTPAVCGLQRFGVGFGFAIMYGALLTKTNRISRIFDSASRSARRPSFISPKSQVMITLCLISVQVAATVIWLIIDPPDVRTEYHDGKRNQVILKCRIKESSFLISLIYNMFLITTCTVYAVKTRKIPENFNESKFIGFTMYTTCIIWLAFVPIYFGTGNSFEIQITTLCVAISLSAYVTLFCLYSPKIYIIVFHPDKNVRKLTMNSATYKKAPTSSTCGTSVNHGICGNSGEQIRLNVHGTPSRGLALESDKDCDSMASL